MCVCAYSAAISQLLPNYTNGALNRWTTEVDFPRPSMSVTNIRTELYVRLIYCTRADKQNNAAPLTAGLCAYERVHFVLRRCFFCSLDTYHLIIFAQIPQKKLGVLDVGLFLHLIFFFFFLSWFLSTPCCACSLVCICMRMCVRACWQGSADVHKQPSV